MKHIIKSLVLATAVATMFTGFTAYAAEGTAPAKPEAATKKPKPATTPMKGKIDAVDTTAKTITVGTRTFAVTSTTKIMKAGQPALFADSKVGEEVGGAYKTDADGKLELTSLRIGPKPAPADKPAPKAKAKEAAPK